MSSDASSPRRWTDFVVELGHEAQRVYDRATHSSSAPGIYVAADRRAGEAAEFAGDIGEIGLGGAVGVGAPVPDAARQIESRLGERAGRPREPRAAGGSAAAVLVLPPGHPGRSASALYRARNDRLETIDVMLLRCDEPCATGGAHIPGRRVSFRPA